MTSSELPRSAQAKFAERLTTAMESAGVNRSATEFARQFNLRSPSENITSHAARKWLKGESIPTQDRLQILADWLHISAAWLRFGDSPETSSDQESGLQRLTASDSTILSDYRRLSASEQKLVGELIKTLVGAQKLKSAK